MCGRGFWSKGPLGQAPTINAMFANRPLPLAAWPLLALLCCAPAWAQSNVPASPTPTSNTERPGDRNNQRTEVIEHEDAGSRINEVRVGGQTQSITVQPKVGDMPAYEVQHSDGVRNRPGSRNGSESTTGPRVWNVMKF